MYTGSIFRKWDLHVHSPASFENQYHFDTGESEQYGGDIWEKYISKLEEIKDICAICVTDWLCPITGGNSIWPYPIPFCHLSQPV